MGLASVRLVACHGRLIVRNLVARRRPSRIGSLVRVAPGKCSVVRGCNGCRSFLTTGTVSAVGGAGLAALGVGRLEVGGLSVLVGVVLTVLKVLLASCAVCRGGRVGRLGRLLCGDGVRVPVGWCFSRLLIYGPGCCCRVYDTGRSMKCALLHKTQLVLTVD